MKTRRLSGFFYAAYLLAFGFLGMAGGVNAEPAVRSNSTGLRIPTREHIEKMEREWPKVVGVKPNQIGASRIQAYQGSKGIAVNRFLGGEGQEITTNKCLPAEAFQEEAVDLPAYVDNSTLPCFPPIGDQGMLGSCVAFASTYYQLTHEIGLLNGYNNKTSNVHILSPKWTYNMLNHGGDNGAYPQDAYTLLFRNGVTSIVNFPYSETDFLSWDLHTQDWIDAMSNRTNLPVYISGIGGSSQDLTQIKQLLNNGHILTFATFAYSWQFSTIPNNRNPNADNRFVGQAAINWLNGESGGHYITLVGYNDNIWIDINGNGQVDPGEMGAFLIANSWGNNWGNNGFIWVAYDAFLSQSAVPGGPNAGRAAMASGMNNYVVSVTGKAANYHPSYIAEFGLTSAVRSEIGISAGISSTAFLSPSNMFNSGAIYFQGGPYGFDGRAASETATFALDLTDLIDPNMPSNNRFYLIVDDNKAGHPTLLGSYSLLHGSQGIAKALNLPQSIDNRSGIFYIDQNELPPPQQLPLQNPIVVIAAPANHAAVSCSLPVAVTAIGSSAAILGVSLYVDGVVLSRDASAPYTFVLDSTKWTNGSHTLTAVAVDAANNSSQASVTIQVHNGCN